MAARAAVGEQGGGGAERSKRGLHNELLSAAHTRHGQVYRFPPSLDHGPTLMDLNGAYRRQRLRYTRQKRDFYVTPVSNAPKFSLRPTFFSAAPR